MFALNLLLLLLCRCCCCAAAAAAPLWLSCCPLLLLLLLNPVTLAAAPSPVRTSGKIIRVSSGLFDYICI